jgi:hypothetical protein
MAIQRLRAALRRRPSAPALELELPVRSGDELRAIPGSERRAETERALAAGHENDESWIVPGYCLACDAPSNFSADWHSSVGGVPNWRERLVCPGCELNNRQRFVAHLVKRHGARDVYLHEQITAFYEWAVRAVPNVQGSEYLGPEYEPGAVVDGVRHEDALALSFADRSFDAIVSQDVFEHVPEIDPALSEAARVLRPGGRMVFSVPFYSSRETTVQVARLSPTGEVVHLEPPEYHGNPVDPEQGSLVYFQHAWDLLDRCRAAGFADAYALAYWSAAHGHIGGSVQLVFVATMA